MPNTDKFLIGNFSNCLIFKSNLCLDLVVNRSRLLIESGHIHQVVAIVQAIGEYYFFVPENLKNSIWPQRLEAFRKFWSSGSPLLGDNNSKG